MDEQRSYRYLIYSLFLLSGISGLIYQIIWTRMLVLVFGNTMLATSTVLSAFMGGLAAGSYVLGRYIDRRPRPLIRVYAVLEAGIGISGLLFPLVLQAATPIYVSLYSVVEGNIILLNLLRFAVCFAIIFVPTFLMGGTLPVLIKRFSTANSSIGHETGFLYGLNTVGAVLGTIACGYFLLRLLGMHNTTLVAVTINLMVAIAAWMLGWLKMEARPDSAAEPKAPVLDSAAPIYRAAETRMVLIGIGLSGFCALAYEVFWTRMLNLFLHNNIYSFTAILGTFLVGIAVGSLIYARFLSKSHHQVRLFVWLQIGIGLISYATPLIFRILHASLFNNFSEALTIAKTAVIMIGPTIMMGIAVPMAIQICQRGASREGTSVGSVYAVNTIGAILGAFVAGFVLLPTLGLHLGVIIVASLNIVAGFLPLFVMVRASRRAVWAGVLAITAAAMFLLAPSDLFRGLYQDAHPDAEIVYYKEGRVANAVVYDFSKLGYKDFHLNAVNEASSRLWHVQLFKLLGLLPTVVHKHPTDALMVAFGAGMSAGACARNVTSLDCVDLNPDIQGIAAAYTRENLDVIHQANFHQVVNDGRNALMLSPRKYSLIISDATNPKMLDSWTLYSQEFYQLVKDRLEPDGVFCQWALIPLPGDAIKVILNTFRSVFPHMSFWVIHGSSQVLMLGTPDRLNIDYADLKARLEPLITETGLADYGVDSVEKFLSFFLLGEEGIDELLTGFEKISTDDLPHAQFYVKQDNAGINNCLDLVRYQESITKYMSQASPPPDNFAHTMSVYEDIARRLNVGFLTENQLKYAEAAVVAADAGMDDANVDHMLNYCPEKQRYFEERLKTHPEDNTARNWLGNIYLMSGNYPAAEKELRTTLAQEPNYAYARINLAMTQIATGDYDDAVAGLLEVQKLNPTKRILYTVKEQLGKLRILRKLAYQPNSAELTRALGIRYYNEGRILDAVRAYRKASQLDSADASIDYNLARICETHEFVPEAARLYDRLNTIAPEEMSVAAKKQLFDLLESDPSQQRQWLNERIVVPSDRPDSMVHPPTCDQALARWNVDDEQAVVDTSSLRRAAQLYEQSTIAMPNDLHAYADAAIICEALGDYEHAAYLWDQAVEVQPDISEIARQAARMKSIARLRAENTSGQQKVALLREVAANFRAVNEPERALEYLDSAVTLRPEQAISWQELAETAVEAGLYPKALDAANRALALDPSLTRAAMLSTSLTGILANAGK